MGFAISCDIKSQYTRICLEAALRVYLVTGFQNFESCSELSVSRRVKLSSFLVLWKASNRSEHKFAQSLAKSLARVNAAVLHMQVRGSRHRDAPRQKAVPSKGLRPQESLEQRASLSACLWTTV